MSISPSEFLKWATVFNLTGGGGGGGETSIVTNMIFVSPKGNDTTGKGTLTLPFQTRARAITAAETFASPTTPQVIVYDSGEYTSADFEAYAWIYDFVPLENSVIYTVTSSGVTVNAASFVSGGNYAMSGLSFDALTSLKLDFSSLGIVANVYIENCTFQSSSLVKGEGATINLFKYGNSFTSGLELDGIHSFDISGGNNINGLDIETTVTSSGGRGTILNNESLGSVTLHSQGGADLNVTIRNSPVFDYTLTQESKSTIELAVDEASWANQTITGSVAIQRLSQAEAINVVHTPVNYTPNPSGDPSVEAAIAGIDDALGSMGGDSVSFGVYQSPQQTIPHNTITQIILNQKNFDTGTYFNTSTYTYTPLIAGVYTFTFQGAWAAPGSSNTTVQFFIYKNGASVAETLPLVIPLGTFANIPPLTVELQMNGTTDYVQVFAKQTQATGTAGLTIANSRQQTYLVGALLDQRGSDVTPSTVLQTIYYSTRGSDTDGDGTIDFPLATPAAALFKALSLLPTAISPIIVYGDAGKYQWNTAQQISPNLIFAGEGVIWSAGSASSITFAPSASWSSTLAYVGFDGITIDSTLTFDLDSTGITNMNVVINYTNMNIVGNCTLKAGASGHQITHNFNSNNLIASGSESASSFDGCTINFFGSHQISSQGDVTMTSTNQSLNFTSIGNCGIGACAITNTASYQTNAFFFAGNTINVSSGITIVSPTGVQLQVDDTTVTQEIQSFVTGNLALFSFANLSQQNREALTLLTDGATTPWAPMIAPSAQWILGGNHELTFISNVVVGGVYVLNIQQDATGGRIPTYDSNFYFPGGTPVINTAPNAVTILVFVFNPNNKMQLVSTSSPMLNNVLTGQSAGRTLALTDSFTQINCSNGSYSTFTVPNNSSVSFPIGTWITFTQTSSTLGLVAASGVNFVSPTGNLTSINTNGFYTGFKIVKILTNTWQVIPFGNLAPIPNTYYFGGGTDGDLTVSSGTTTLTRDTFYKNVTISGTAKIIQNGFRLWVSGTLDATNAPAGAFDVSGGNGGNASGQTGGTASANGVIGTIGVNFGTIGNVSGGVGGSGGSGTSKTQTGTTALANGVIGAVGGAGGNPGAGGGGSGVGGTSTNSSTVTASLSINRFDTFLGKFGTATSIQQIQGGGAGVGGGGGSGCTDGANGTQIGGGAGAGGNGGNILFLSANTILVSSNTADGFITANGGNGGNGDQPIQGFGGFGCGGGGGGGGGSGGWIYVAYGTYIDTDAGYVFNACHANGGNGGNGANGGPAGSVAAAGSPGVGGTGGSGGRITVLNLGNNINTSGVFSASVTETIGSAGSSPSGQTGGAGNSLNAPLNF